MNQPFDASRQVECLPGVQALDVFEHVARVRFGGRLAQPSQPGHLAVAAALEQVIEATAMHVRKRFGQGFVDAPVGAGDGLGADALDDIERRKDDVPVSQRIKNAGGQHDALVRLQGELSRSPHRLPVMRQAERLQTQVGAQFKQMLAPGFLALGVLRPATRIGAQLLRDPLHEGRRHGGIGQ